MSVVYLMEWDNPKDEERNKKRIKFQKEVVTPYIKKLVKEKGIKVESSNWRDDTGHRVNWYKFESMEDFTKMGNDERRQQITARWALLADNVRTRLLRPVSTIPLDLWK